MGLGGDGEVAYPIANRTTPIAAMSQSFLIVVTKLIF